MLGYKGLLLFAVGVAPAYADQLQYLSEPDDFIGQGLDEPVTMNYEAGTIRLSQSSFTREITIQSPVDADPWWVLVIRGVDNEQPKIGCYERAQRSPFVDAGRPGIDFSMDHRGCNTISGRYWLRELQTDAQGAPTAIAVDFVQHCEAGGDALFGSVRAGSALATSLTMDPVFTLSGRLDYTAEKDGIGGTSTGPVTRSIPFTRHELDAKRNFDKGVAFWFDGPVPGITGDRTWSLDFAGPDETEIVAGNYGDAERFPFQSAGHPGLSFSFGGTCNTATGSFSVGSVAYDAVEADVLDRLPMRFNAMFDQRCVSNGQPGPLTRGTVEFTRTMYQTLNVPGLISRTGFEEDEPSLSLFRNCSH
jgi:hypothetical protein